MTNEFDYKGCKFDDIISGSMCRNCKRRISKECMADWYSPVEPTKPELPPKVIIDRDCYGSGTEDRINKIIDYLAWLMKDIEK